MAHTYGAELNGGRSNGCAYADSPGHVPIQRMANVSLQPDPDGRHYHGVAVVTERPASGRFIRGTCLGGSRIRYGIESYFVQEGKGKAYEDAVRRSKLWARVALAADGTPALRGLVIE